MQYAVLMSFVFLISCSSAPQLYQSIEDIANNDAIDITISKEAFQKNKNVNVLVDIKNEKN